MKIVKLSQTLFWKHNELSAAGLVERLLQAVTHGEGSSLPEDFSQYSRVMNKYHRNNQGAGNAVTEGFWNWVTAEKKVANSEEFLLEVLFSSWSTSLPASFSPPPFSLSPPPLLPFPATYSTPTPILSLSLSLSLSPPPPPPARCSCLAHPLKLVLYFTPPIFKDQIC
jgi:hypothetical protein